MSSGHLDTLEIIDESTYQQLYGFSYRKYSLNKKRRQINRRLFIIEFCGDSVFHFQRYNSTLIRTYV